jgi:hypothetical protein
MLILYTAWVWDDVPDDVITNVLPGGEVAYGSKRQLLTPIIGAVALTVLNPIIRQLAHHTTLFDEDVSASTQALRKAKHWCSWSVFGTILLLVGFAAGRLAEGVYPEFSFSPLLIGMLAFMLVGVLTAFIITGIQRLNASNK